MSLTMDDLNKAENDIEKVCIEANRDCHKCIFFLKILLLVSFQTLDVLDIGNYKGD